MKEVKAKLGEYLTQAKDVPDKERVYIKAIKGENVKEEDWREATQKEKKAFEDSLEKPNPKGDEKHFLSKRYLAYKDNKH